MNYLLMTFISLILEFFHMLLTPNIKHFAKVWEKSQIVFITVMNTPGILQFLAQTRSCIFTPLLLLSTIKLVTLDYSHEMPYFRDFE